MADCSLYHYYDGMPSICADAELSWGDRLTSIVDRYDEVIELGQEDGNDGVLFRRIKKYIESRNESKRKPSDDSPFSEQFDRSKLIPEKKLYEALQKLRVKLRDGGSRMPC